jgi:hypothetical protein
VVKIAMDPDALAANVADLIAAKIRHGGVGELLVLASLPAFLAADFKRSDWQLVLHQLEALGGLLRSPERPSWLRPLLADTRWLLAVIHSRLFLPASWSFPLWHPDFGASLVGANDELFQETCSPDEARRHRRRVELLLQERLAVWRFHRGVGSRRRFLGLLQALEGEASSGEPGWTMLAARVLAEYLEALAVGGREERDLREELTALWNELGGDGSQSEPALWNRNGPLLETAPARLINTASNAELLGLSRLLAVSRDNGAEARLLDLVRFALGEGEKAGVAESRWITLDVAEILKRQEDFFAALRLLPAEPCQQDLDSLGFRIDQNRFGTAQVLTIRPGPALALRNRLPEATEEEQAEIARGKFSATVIFDVLLQRRSAVSPLWTPRVFRILDSIADLDPENVQPVAISFESTELIKPLNISLPLPTGMDTEEARAEQEKRKAIVARFVAVMIYNSAIATSVESARVQCAALDPGRQEAGFSTGELVEALAQIASRQGYDAYGHFVQGFNFRPFTVTAGGPADNSVPFGGADLSYGAFLGIDIGGTDIKMCLFEAAEPGRHPLRTISTFEDNSEGVPVLRFVDRILDEAERYLEGRLSWRRLDGIGISWPGAVRDAKIVGYSRTLGRLQLPEAGHLRALGPDASPQEIQSADLVRFFRQRLRERGMDVPELLAIAIENDGNAEAYGNYCLIEMQGAQVPGAKVVIKLGTSLAGGHIDAAGAISAHVSEFSKVVLDFCEPPEATAGVYGSARDWVSSKAVRTLSRSFVFNKEVVFGSLGGLNDSDDNAKERLEAVEVGELLNLWREVDEEPIRDSAFLREMVEADNLQGGVRAKELRQRLAAAQGPGTDGASPALKEYVDRRGCERYALERKVAKDGVRERCTAVRKRLLEGASLPAADEELLTEIWQLGMKRLLLLVEGRSMQCSAHMEELPAELDRDRLAAKVLGAVGLVSQLGLQTAHLVVALYNLYRKERMKGVILAGGVLAGATGHIVRVQTERFLLKYYDKVFGPGKNLTPDSIRLAQTYDPAIVGPLGAAMSANRLHRIQSQRSLQQIIHHTVERLTPGETLRLPELAQLTADLRGHQEGLKDCLEELVAASRLLPLVGQEGSYLKM